jgi:ATP-dependent protease HslVU (ClpYQ) peptidase subunit
MTCIAAVAQGGRVWMGGDTAGVAGWDVSTRRDEKVFRIGEAVVGFTTSFRMGQLLRYRLTLPPAPAGEELARYMATEFIDAVRDCFREGGWAKKNAEQEEGGTFLIGLRGRLFQVDSDYQVAEPADLYEAVGSGFAYAKGSLCTSAGRRPAERVRLALEAAAKHCIGVRAPFTILRAGTIRG